MDELLQKHFGCSKRLHVSFELLSRKIPLLTNGNLSYETLFLTLPIQLQRKILMYLMKNISKKSLSAMSSLISVLKENECVLDPWIRQLLSQICYCSSVYGDQSSMDVYDLHDSTAENQFCITDRVKNSILTCTESSSLRHVWKKDTFSVVSSSSVGLRDPLKLDASYSCSESQVLSSDRIGTQKNVILPATTQSRKRRHSQEVDDSTCELERPRIPPSHTQVELPNNPLSVAKIHEEQRLLNAALETGKYERVPLLLADMLTKYSKDSIELVCKETEFKMPAVHMVNVLSILEKHIDRLGFISSCNVLRDAVAKYVLIEDTLLPRNFVALVVSVTRNNSKIAIKGIIVPLMTAENLSRVIEDLLGKIFHERILKSSDIQWLLENFFDDWVLAATRTPSEGVISILQKLFDESKFVLTEVLVPKFITFLQSVSKPLQKSLKFGKLLFTIVNSSSNTLLIHKELMLTELKENQTFMGRKAVQRLESVSLA